MTPMSDNMRKAKMMPIIAVIMIVIIVIPFFRHYEEIPIFEQSVYETLPGHQKEFIARVFQQESHVGNILPFGVTDLNDSPIDISIRYEVKGDVYHIFPIINLQNHSPANPGRIRIAILLNSDEWQTYEQASIRTYEGGVIRNVIERAIFVSFSSDCFEFRANNVDAIIGEVQVTMISDNARRQVIIGYIERRTLGLFDIARRVNGNPIRANYSVKWAVLEF